MTIEEFLTQLTRIFFVLLMIITLIDYLRYRDRVRRDVALVFVSLSINIIIVIFVQATGLQLPWLLRLGAVAVLAQPYLLLRLVRYLRPVPRLLYRGAVLAMIASWVLVLIFQGEFPPPVLLLIIAYFVAIDGYAVLAFFRGGSASTGVVRHRLTFAAAGSGLLVAALFLVGVRLVLPDPSVARNILTPLIQVAAILSTLAYYLAFASPRWLRQMWQMLELKQYLEEIRSLENRTVAGMIDLLHQSVARAMDTDMIVVALWDDTAQVLEPQRTVRNVSPADFDADGVVWQAWRDRTPVARQQRYLTGADAQVMQKLDAETLFVVPLITSDRAIGLVMVFLRFGSLFVDDDLRLLEIYAQQTVTMLENFEMVEKLHHQAEALELKVQERTKALQRSNDELRQFAYIASHDLQEPLRTVSNYLQLIESRYPDKLDDAGREFIAFAVDGAVRMKNLINALLTYSRIDSRERKITLVDCQKVVDEVQRLLEATIKEAEADITIDNMPKIRADEQLLVQLFQNLISNAIKYHGTEKPKIQVSAVRDKNFWRFSVQDNGIGIEPQYMERIFVIFQRLHLQTEYPGTGIGLAICKKVVELHGGRIWVESEAGKGTTFLFTLPATG